MDAEACALSYAIQIADQLGMGKVIFETDCINLQQAMNSSNYSMSTIGNLISDMQFRLRMDFIEARVVYVSRNCNKPAQELAVWGCG